MRRTVTAALSAAAIAACGSELPSPVMDGRQGMLSKTSIAQKCEEAAKGHDRPFVIEWDATDLASFEASAQQRTMFVRYEGCKLDVLYECKDPFVVTRLGSYGQPHFTSGSVQGVDIANEGELYAKLPLGAATLSGKLKGGEGLHLKYFVSGVATSSRDAIYRGELQKVPGCEGATHYVWAYNLGAFELETKQSTTGEAQAGLGGAGIGATKSQSQAQLGHGGELASCTTQDQRACRVPIRLALRSIKDGQNPLDGAGGGGGAAGGAPGTPGGPPLSGGANVSAIMEGMNATKSAAEMISDANKKLYEAHDGQACLQLMDRAAGLDPRQAESHGFNHTYSRCLMVAGKCDEGQKRFRAMLAAEDVKRLKTDQAIDQEVRDVANDNCPSQSATNDVDFVIRSSMELHRSGTDAKTCKTKFEAIFSRIRAAADQERDARTQGKPTAGRSAWNSGTQALEVAAKCVAEKGSCKEGLGYHKRQYCLVLRDSSSCGKTATENWATQIKLKQVKCAK